MSNKVWIAPGRKGELKARVDDKVIPFGKENAISVTDAQLQRLRDADVPVQTESGGDSGSSSDSNSSDSGGNS